jgi:serine/threonine-protein kinase SRPK3
LAWVLKYALNLFDGNIMILIQDQAVLDKAVDEKWSSPGPCKIHGEPEIYLSADLGLPDPVGVPIISDFGDSHFGDPPFFNVMLDLYRAPEIVLAIPWDEKIEIWGFGLMVSSSY